MTLVRALRAPLFAAAALVLGVIACSGRAPTEDAPAAKAVAVAKGARDWPMLGGTPMRNLANPLEKGILDDFSVARGKKGVDKNVKWSATLGTKSYGGPVIAGGRLFIGTNNERPRDLKLKGVDLGVMMCFRESDGQFLWQITHDRIDDDNDCPRYGVLSNPCVDGDRLYYVSNAGVVVCADVAGDPKSGKGKVLWTYDMIGELKVFPNQASNCSPLVVDDLVFVITGNGRNANNNTFPNPKAPSFIAVNKKTGKLAWQSSLPGKGVMFGQWTSPAAAKVGGKWQVLFPGGDGWLYGLEPKTGALIWKFDLNPKKATPYKPGGSGEAGFAIAVPVVHDGKCYLAIAQEPESDGPGVGHLWCIDITKTPKNKDKDLSPVKDNFDPKAAVNKDSGLVWHVGGAILPRPDEGREFHFGRTLSTCAVHDGLCYAAELAGYLSCFDAKTGKKYWEYDFNENTWCSPFYVDGKVYIGVKSGKLYVFEHGKKASKPKEIQIGGALDTPPVAVNGVLYLTNGPSLWAIAPKK